MNDRINPAGAKADDDPPGIEFVDLREGRCRFPLGGINDPPERFCGAPAEIGTAYCPECQKKAYSRQERRR